MTQARNEVHYVPRGAVGPALPLPAAAARAHLAWPAPQGVVPLLRPAAEPHAHEPTRDARDSGDHRRRHEALRPDAAGACARASTATAIAAVASAAAIVATRGCCLLPRLSLVGTREEPRRHHVAPLQIVQRPTKPSGVRRSQHRTRALQQAGEALAAA